MLSGWKRIGVLFVGTFVIVSHSSDLRGRTKTPVDIPMPTGVENAKCWEEAVFNVMDFGAVGDGISDDSKAVQDTLLALLHYQRQRSNTKDSSCIYPSLYFPHSRTFITAPFNLTSHMVLRVDGTLRAISNATENFEDRWPKLPPLPSYGSADDAGFFLQYQSLIFAKDVTDLKIVGEGVIDGVGQWWWDAFYRRQGSTALHGGRPNLIQLQNCSNIEIYQIEIQNSPFWTLHALYCQNMVIRNIRIRAPMYAPNVDGIDLDSCQNVLVEGCDISCGDDHIAIKAGVCGTAGDTSLGRERNDYDHSGIIRTPVDADRVPIHCAQDTKFINGDYVSRNITIASNTLGTGMGIALGSELSGGIEDAVIRNNRIGYGCWYGHDDPEWSCGWSHALHIKTTLTRGGYIRNIHFLDNIVYNTTGIFYLETDYQDKDRQVPPTDYPVTDIRGITLEGTNGLGAAKTIAFACSPFMTCKEITVMDTYVHDAPDSNGREDYYHCAFVESYTSERNHPRGLRRCFQESMNRTATVLAN